MSANPPQEPDANNVASASVGEPPTRSTTDVGADLNNLMELYGTRLDNEHTHIASRTGWLLTLNAFLVATLGIAVANTDKIAEDLAFGLVLIVAGIGALSNASCLFSNYWAGRAIDEASQRVSVELAARLARARQSDSRPVDQADLRADAEEMEWWLSRLRLYGRDPRAEPERVGFWLPPSGVLHPWFLLPSIFIITFIGSPTAFAAYFDMGAESLVAGMVPALLLVVTFGAGLLADRVYNAKKEGIGVGEYGALRRMSSTTAREAALSRREARGHVNRAMLQGAHPTNAPDDGQSSPPAEHRPSP